MGNCIGAAFSQNEDKKFWRVDDKLSSRAKFSKLCKRQLRLSETEMDRLIQKCSSISLETPADVADNFYVRRVKIVVNKKQWKRLMGSKEEIQLRHMVLQSLLRRAKKWRPSLAAIPEL